MSLPQTQLSFGSFDPEGVTFGEGHLFVLDGLGGEVYVLDPGNNGVFEGTAPAGDDILLNHFDTSSMGLADPEGIEYSTETQTLFIVGPTDRNNLIETTTSGTFLNLTDISFLNALGPAGIAIAPGSLNPGINNLYIADRGVDNGSDPNENDGKIYEITFESGATPGPTLTPTNTSSPTETQTPSPTASGGVTVLDVRINDRQDDAEESTNGSMHMNSSDLELVYDRGNQTIGMRFNNLTIPRNSFITQAYIQFIVDETSSVPTDLTIAAEAADSSGIFTTSSNNISSRQLTNANTRWSPVPWLTIGQAGLDQRTPDLAAVVQEVINRPGWVSGNSLTMIITGSGERIAESHNGDAGGAPLLHIEYQATIPADTPSPTFTNTPSPTITETPSPTSTNSPTPTSTDTPEPLPTSTSTPTSTNTAQPTATGTLQPTATNTPQPTITNTPQLQRIQHYQPQRLQHCQLQQTPSNLRRRTHKHPQARRFQLPRTRRCHRQPRHHLVR